MQARHLPALLALGVTLPAQATNAVVPFEGICERLELAHAATQVAPPRRHASPHGGVPDEFLADQALKNLVTAWIHSDEALARARRSSIVQFTPNRAMLLVAADQQVVDAVIAAAEQLQREDLHEHAVLCTIVTLPGAVATAHGLLPDQAKNVDEAAAGKLLKAAIGSGGSLHNLPEARGLPLIPFALGALPAAAKKVVAPAAPPTDLGCVALPIGAAKALLQVTAPGSKPQFLQLQASQGALLRLGEPARRAGEGDPQNQDQAPARVLWLRYVGSAPRPPREPERAPPARDQKGMSP